MTDLLFRNDAYQRDAEGRVVQVTEDGNLVLDQSLFYPTSGGQPGDAGLIRWDGGEATIATTVKGQGTQVVLVPDAESDRPAPGTAVQQRIDWERRYGHMRVHTALHLLSVVIPLPVSGGAIGAEKGRLDFNMETPPEDKLALQDALNALIARDLPVAEDWITDEELAANPGLVKTMSVAPPMGAGRVRLVRIGEGADQIDLQPCGGTHVARTGEIGKIRLGKIEKKGALNRRVYLHLDP